MNIIINSFKSPKFSKSLKILIVYISFFSLFSFPAFAQTKSASSSGKLNTSIQSLKDKIATKVAELRKDQEKLITGHIEKIDKNSIVVNYQEQKLSISLDDTITKFYSVSSGKKEIKKTDLKVGDYLILKGIIIDNTITSNSIYKDDEYLVGSGKIIGIDEASDTIKVVTTTKEELTIVIGKDTKEQLLDIRSLIFGISSISKMKQGDIVHYVAKKSTEDKITKVTAEKIVTIPQEYFISPTK